MRWNCKTERDDDGYYLPYGAGFLWLPKTVTGRDGKRSARWLEYARWTQDRRVRELFEDSDKGGWVPIPRRWIDDDDEWQKIIDRPVTFQSYFDA